jgi:hypothetical protein
MTAAVAQPVRFVAFADDAPIVLRDVEDLHDADLDQILAGEIPDAAAAVALARLVARSGPAAVTAHDLGAGASRLALR